MNKFKRREAYFYSSPMKTTPLEILRRETLLKIEKLSYSITSFVQATLRDLLSTRFRPLDGILRAISSRKIRGEKRSRKRSNWVNCSRQDSSSSSSSSREREKGSKHGRDVFRKTNEISFHERGRHRRKGMLLCVVTCEQSLSSMYIRALMEFPVWENARACHD